MLKGNNYGKLLPVVIAMEGTFPSISFKNKSFKYAKLIREVRDELLLSGWQQQITIKINYIKITAESFVICNHLVL